MTWRSSAMTRGKSRTRRTPSPKAASTWSARGMQGQYFGVLEFQLDKDNLTAPLNVDDRQARVQSRLAVLEARIAQLSTKISEASPQGPAPDAQKLTFYQGRKQRAESDKSKLLARVKVMGRTR